MTTIVIEAEAPGDSRTLFRVLIGDKVMGEHLTAAQAHILVGDILQQIALPRTPVAPGRAWALPQSPPRT
jgi:hypothetical protein